MYSERAGGRSSHGQHYDDEGSDCVARRAMDRPLRNGPLRPFAMQSTSESEPQLSPVAMSRRLLAEFVGTALLVMVVVGSGIAAQRLSPNDVGLRLLETSTATVFGLAALILLFGPVSGAHFNPLISAADWVLGGRTGTGISANDVAAYTVVQIVGGIGGAVLANIMFDRPAIDIATKGRLNSGDLIAEMVATAGLIALFFALARTGRAALSAAAVGAYIGAAFWFTASPTLANPAVTIGRIFTDTFTGIGPGFAPWFIGAQIIGALIGLALIATLYPDTTATEDDLVIPNDQATPATRINRAGDSRKPRPSGPA
jgi:glycerol uptake facilitator-like aquaporin